MHLPHGVRLMLITTFIIVYINKRAPFDSSVSTEGFTADHERGNCIEQHSKQDLFNSTILFTIAWVQVASSLYSWEKIMIRA